MAKTFVPEGRLGIRFSIQFSGLRNTSWFSLVILKLVRQKAINNKKYSVLVANQMFHGFKIPFPDCSFTWSKGEKKINLDMIKGIKGQYFRRTKTSLLICCANQLPWSCAMETFVLNELSYQPWTFLSILKSLVRKKYLNISMHLRSEEILVSIDSHCNQMNFKEKWNYL